MIKGVVERFLFAVMVIGIAIGNPEENAFAAENEAASELATALGQAKLFAGLTDAERTALESAATLRLCKKGERIIEQGKTTGLMFIILEAGAEVMVNGKIVTTLPAHSLVGEIEFLDRGPATADVALMNDSRCIALNNAALDDLMEKQPRLGYALMSKIARIEAARLRAMDMK